MHLTTTTLTRREEEVLSLYQQSKTRREIASMLLISRKTVSQHLELVKLKRGVKSVRHLRQEVLALHPDDCDGENHSVHVTLHVEGLHEKIERGGA